MFARRDWLIAAAIFAAALALRLPCRSRLAYWWDCAQSAIAIEDYNLAHSQPHVPGYFLYIVAGRAVNKLVGDPLMSLVWLSAVCGAGLAAVGYLLGAAMFGRGCGAATAAILATGLVTSFHSCVGLMHGVDALLVSVTVLACWWTVRGGTGWRGVVVLAMLMALVGGVRQQTVPILAPVWLYAFWHMRPPRVAKLAGGLLLTGLLCWLWFAPMVQTTGGLAQYRELLAAHQRVFDKATPFGGGGWNSFCRNVFVIVGSCWISLLAAAVLAAAEAARWLVRESPETRRSWYAAHRAQLWLLGWWVVPMVAFWVCLYVLWPGYVLGYLPAVALLAGLGVNRCATRLAQRWGVWGRSLPVAVVVAVNVVAFAGPPAWAQNLLLGLPLTARELREHERQLAAWLAAIRTRFRPDEVLICHRFESLRWGFRHFQYHLPEYENVMLSADPTLPAPWGTKFWYGAGRRTRFADRFDARGRKTLLLIVPPDDERGLKLFTEQFDVSRARRWEIAGSAPLYVLEAP